jgi:predicted glycogen debranching enzyme
LAAPPDSSDMLGVAMAAEAGLIPIVIDTETCRDYGRSSRLEWLEANGTGAFAMGTVSGANTRRYHGLLVASLHPPVERRVLLARVEEEIDGVNLGTCQYPGVVNPAGFQHLLSFTPDPFPTWIYEVNSIRIEKRLFLVEGRQMAVLRYFASQPCRLRVRPFLADRDYHSLQHAGISPDPIHFLHSGGAFSGD